MNHFRTYLLISLFAALGACGADDKNDAVECEQTCSTDATCNTSGDVGVCECNAGFTGDGLTCTADDVCAGVSNCTEARITCSGDDLVTCQADENGCLVESAVDCTATNEICDDTGDAPTCVAGCTDDPACELLSAGDAFCDGNTIVSCETNVDGCLAPVDGTDCALEVCDESGAAPACIANASGDSCAEPFLVQDDVALTGADITVDFTDVENFTGDNCLGVSATGTPVEAVFTVPLLAGETVGISEFGGVDVVLGILPACDGTTACYASVDGFGGTRAAIEEAGVSYTAEADETVTVFAAAFSGTPSPADYDIRVSITQCGDGVTEGPETCDDGNADDGDGCSACAVDFGFECDNTAISACTGPVDLGTFAAAEAIPDTVETVALAQNDSFFYSITFSEDVVIEGTLDGAAGEDIDIGFFNDAGELMFDAATSGGEVFSDQLLVAGTYTIEVVAFEEVAATGWTLAMSTVAGPVCGDGIVGIGEACDDNMVDNDGCTQCEVDPGFTCDNTNNPSVCVLSCGDGILDTGEECDDGNLIDDDRCADACTLNADVLDLDGNDDFANAQLITAGQVARGSLDPAGLDALDIYTFTLVDTSWVTLEQYTTVDGDLGNYTGPGLDNTLDCGNDLQLRVFDGMGDPTDNTTALLFDDDGGDGFCGFLGQPADGTAVLLAAGTYFVKVSEFGDNDEVPLYALDIQIDAVLADGDACNTAFDLCDPATLACDPASDTCVAPVLDRANFELFLSGQFDLANTSFTFTPAGDDFGIVGATAVAFPDTPGAGTVASSLGALGDDDSETVTTAFAFPFFGVDETTYFVNSNGNITFGAGDTDFSESVADHFDTPRISFFFDDLSPQNGTVTYDEFPDHLTVTFEVPSFGGNDINVQVQLFDTGVITMTYLTVVETDCLVGISAGDGLGNEPVESDFSSLLL